MSIGAAVFTGCMYILLKTFVGCIIPFSYAVIMTGLLLLLRFLNRRKKPNRSVAFQVRVRMTCYVCLYVCMYVGVYLYTYIHMYVCMYVAVYICTYIHMCKKRNHVFALQVCVCVACVWAVRACLVSQQ